MVPLAIVKTEERTKANSKHGVGAAKKKQTKINTGHKSAFMA